MRVASLVTYALLALTGVHSVTGAWERALWLLDGHSR
jgi:hypothetical protein